MYLVSSIFLLISAGIPVIETQSNRQCFQKFTNYGMYNSPGYPRRHQGRSMYCHWLFEVPTGSTAQLEFNDFLIDNNRRNDRRCQSDFIELRDGYNLRGRWIGRYCGHFPAKFVKANGRHILMTYASYGGGRTPAFKLTFSSVQNLACGVPAVNPEASMMTPNLERSVNFNQNKLPIFDINAGSSIGTFKPYIVGGTAAKQYSWPWHAMLTLNGRQACGGALVSNWHILTAAHCFAQFSDPSSWKVALGNYYENTVEQDEKWFDVRYISVHPYYRSPSWDNDVAVLTLSSAVQFSKAILSVCLPERSVPSGVMCYATGHGRTQGTGFDDRLKQAKLPVIGYQECRQVPDMGSKLTRNMLCAGYPQGGTDACKGDSGGPFVCKTRSGYYEIQGIISWGPSWCAQPRKVGVYTKVFNYLPWIRQQIGGSG